MKIYRVVTERDGKTIKAPGVTSTEVVREDRRFAAMTMQQVWDAIADLRLDPEFTVIAIIEEHPLITVLADV